jgi:ribosomal protein S18 acetylase RimI-like enzyme
MFERAQPLEQEVGTHQPDSSKIATQTYTTHHSHTLDEHPIQFFWGTSGKLNARQARQLQARSGNRVVGRFLQGRVSGLPERLKQGVESLSGLPMDDVRVHYNSPKPAELQALAYTQGNQIYVGPGQEQHLPHEAWHVVQQKLGRVRPTMQIDSMAVNADPSLESEAEQMGRQAAAPVQAKAAPQQAVKTAVSRPMPVGNGRYQIIASLGTEIAGSLLVHDTGATAVEITNLNVDPAHRKQGLGRELLASAARAGRQLGKSTLTLAAQDSGSGRLTQWYKALGFTQTGDKQNGYPRMETPVGRLVPRISQFKKMPLLKSGWGQTAVAQRMDAEKKPQTQSRLTTSTESQVASADPEEYVILIHGCHSSEQLDAIVGHSTAGGATPARDDGQAPSEAQAVEQVKFEGAPWATTGARQAARRQTNDVEYTTDASTAIRFGMSRGGVVVVKIQKKYLNKGSGTENGWICFKDAPVEVLDHRKNNRK